MNRLWLICVFGLIHAFVFMVLYEGAFPGHAEPDSSPLYLFYASNVFDGQLPYRDFSIEYAPLSLPLFLLPRLVADTPSEYHVAFAAEMLLFDLIGLVLISLLARRLGAAPWKALLAYTMFLLAIGSIIAYQFDLVAAVMVLFSLYAFSRGWNTAGWIGLGLGTMTKIYPIVVVPVLLLYLLSQRDFRRLVQGGLTFAGTIVLISIPCLILSPSGFYDSFSYHAERGIQIESTYSSVFLLGDIWGLDSPVRLFDYGAWEIRNSVTDALVNLTPGIMLLAMASVYLLYVRELRSARRTHDPNTQVVLYATLAIVAFMLANKVFSPQYIIWLYPLIPVIVLRSRFLLWAAFISIGVLTQYIYPDHYLDLIAIKTEPVYVLALRNALLVGFAVILWRGSTKQLDMPSGESRS
ncbi:MAG: glycosyltransferase 87 family protein [Dehalococcoidia bacterium]|nr:glycosyltransferase 87 family protein [Dehalococcoidia bacterium]